jgi:hypothetical protein
MSFVHRERESVNMNTQSFTEMLFQVRDTLEAHEHASDEAVRMLLLGKLETTDVDTQQAAEVLVLLVRLSKACERLAHRWEAMEGFSTASSVSIDEAPGDAQEKS